MSRDFRPIIAYHAVFSAYGFWLPNDERGSYSTTVWAPRLQRFGPPVSPGTSRSVAKRPFDRQRRDAARAELNYPPVCFSAAQIAVIAKAVGGVVTEYELPVYAAAFLADHVHLVFDRRKMDAEAWVGYFKRAASRDLREAGLHPFQTQALEDNRLPTPWGEGGWNDFLHNEVEILRSIRYVEENPLKAGLPAQSWDFVTRYC